MYEYKVVNVPNAMVVEKGLDLSQTVAKFIETKANELAQEGWEFYRKDDYAIAGILGCLAAFCGQNGQTERFALLTFRREKV